jgi:hypothetical protein
MAGVVQNIAKLKTPALKAGAIPRIRRDARVRTQRKSNAACRKSPLVRNAGLALEALACLKSLANS